MKRFLFVAFLMLGIFANKSNVFAQEQFSPLGKHDIIGIIVNDNFICQINKYFIYGTFEWGLHKESIYFAVKDNHFSNELVVYEVFESELIDNDKLKGIKCHAIKSENTNALLRYVYQCILGDIESGPIFSLRTSDDDTITYLLSENKLLK